MLADSVTSLPDDAALAAATQETSREVFNSSRLERLLPLALASAQWFLPFRIFCCASANGNSVSCPGLLNACVDDAIA